nr:hypothetical protein BaRGS_004515 [Batillaria attramentaria]
MTVATEGTDGFKRFMRSANKYGFKVKVLGMGKEWRGRDVKNSADGGHKVNLLRNELTKYKNDKNLLIMFTESLQPVWDLRNRYSLKTVDFLRLHQALGFIGYAPDLYQIVHYNALKDDGDDQSYYTSIFLDRLLGEELHIKDVARFLDKHSKEYRSVTHISPFSNIGNAVARNLGLEKCVEQNCQYYFSVDSVAQLTDPDTLNTLIGQNRTIISPMLSIPRTLASNFWGTLNEEGFYALSEDYMDLVEARKINGNSIIRRAKLSTFIGKFLRSPGQPVYDAAHHVFVVNVFVDCGRMLCVFLENVNIVIFSESTNSRGTKLGMLIDNHKTFQNISF